MTTKQSESISTLESLLKQHNKPYQIVPLFDGVKFIFTNDTDAIMHQYSYGGPDGLFETMGFHSDNSDVTGYLEPHEVLNKVLLG